MNSRSTEEYDYVIAGGGTAGCALFARLSENPDTTVLLLEAGNDYPAGLLPVPLAGMSQKEHFSWNHFTCQQESLAYRRIAIPSGKILGGSSSVNAMIYCRGNPRNYDRWRELGNPTWSFSDLLPYFRRFECRQAADSDLYGTDGPVAVSDARHRAPFSEAFVEACLEIGIPAARDFNGYNQEGSGYYLVTQRRGQRVSSASAYIHNTTKHVNSRIQTGALVHRIIIESHRAAGIEYIDGTGNIRKARAAREVILCSGAVNSPKILMLSGIGPSDSLKNLGIEIRQDLPGVGHNLQDHVRIPVLYRSERSSPGDKARWIPAAVDYALRRKGVMTSNCCESGAMVCSTSEAQIPDLQFVTHFQSALYPECLDLQFCLVNNPGRGCISLASADPRNAPIINPNYLSRDVDIKLALSGMRLARRIAQATPLKKFPLKEEIFPGSDIDSDELLTRYFRTVAESCYHLVGTCKMGNTEMDVVDSELRVYGIEGLRVADASIMPELPNGNTAAATWVIAEKAADLIKHS